MKAKKAAVTTVNQIHSSKLSISISNALVNAAQGLTLAEKRIIMFAVSKLNPLLPDGGHPDGIVRISAMDYAEEFQVDPDTAYRQLKAATDQIFNRYISWLEPISNNGVKQVKARWVSRAEYAEGQGWIAVRFTRDVAPHLVELRGKFTTYQLSQAAALRSLYSWRLLEMLSQFESTGWRQVPIEDFCHAMDATDKQRENFNNIKRRIIEPAVKELCEKDGWLIDWKPIKDGRRVAALRFEFKRDPQGRLDV